MSKTAESQALKNPAIDALEAETARVQVVRYRPGAWFWWSLPFAVALVAVVAYKLGAVGRSVQTQGEQLSEMQAEFDQDRMDELRAELTELRLAQTADVGANQEVRASFIELQSEIASLEEEVAFYRSLMAPKELSKGLRIEKMRLLPTERPGVFGYELVIAQTVARHVWACGARPHRNSHNPGVPF